MEFENSKDLELYIRLCNWLNEKGMTPEYFFDMLKEIGFVFPMRLSNFTEESETSFSFLCSSATLENSPISYRILLDTNESSHRIITFCDVHGFWKQPMQI